LDQVKLNVFGILFPEFLLPFFRFKHNGCKIERGAAKFTHCADEIDLVGTTFFMG